MCRSGPAAALAAEQGWRVVYLGPSLPAAEIAGIASQNQARAVALNHLDIWVRNGLPGSKLAMPHVLGADGAGVVAEVGAEVSRVQVGERVLITPGLNCGVCEFCQAGEQSLGASQHRLRQALMPAQDS